MRILVTGAGGFVGRRLVAALVERGHRVGQLLLEPDEGSAAESRFHGDLRDRDTVAGVMTDFAPQAVAHLGALSEVASSWQRVGEYFVVNVLGTANVVDTAPAGCRVVFASSAEVYGIVPGEAQPIREERPPHPESPYAMSKAAAELVALRAGAVVVRSFNLVGPGQSPRFALPSFAAQLAEIAAGKRSPRLLVGNLSARRDYLHVDDGVDGYVVLLEMAAGGEVYNLASGQSVEVGEALRRLIAITGLQVSVEVEAARLRPVDVPLLCGNAGRLRGLGWQPRRGLDRALGDLWQSVGS
ncbi:MAG TPA: GDP-mannose 4,6-dehydratase [Thermoanaerobaculia bacterium]|nr:GDP-mannose 4,6-dehydratase [Thermoanaerobaculia bacterium]